MARGSVRVEGLGRLRRALGRVGRSMVEGADDGQQQVSEFVADQWRGGVPVDTGEYQNSIQVDEDGVFSDVPHGPFVEFGTSTRAAVPAGAAAAEAARARMPSQVGKAVRRKLP